MSDQKNVFTEMNGDFPGNLEHQEAGKNYFNPKAFRECVEARRSVRKYTAEKIPDDVVDDCLDLALLAPNSSNLQAWEFYRIKNKQVWDDVVYGCFSQPAASTAAEMIVCVARADHWKEHCRLMLEELYKMPVAPPRSAVLYYKKLAPFVYTMGPLSCLTPFKWIFNSLVGLFKVVPREPISLSELDTWAIKSCALACENLMLAFRSHGYDSCPMEGFDSVKVKRAMGLPRRAKIVMIVSAGKRDLGGIYGPRIRFERSRLIKTI